MSWQCPECHSPNDDSILRCVCGHELDASLNDKRETLLQNGGGSIQEIDWHEIAIESSPQTGSTATVQRLRDILLSVMFSKPVYIFSWIALIGLSITVVLWLFLAIKPSLLSLPILILCGIIAANIAKRKGKSPWLWFLYGLITIGIPFYFALILISIIVANLFPF